MSGASAEIGELAKALASAQVSFRVAAQDGLNPHFRSKFATLASITAAAQPALSQAGLAIVQLPSVEGKVVAVETRLLHSSGQWISCSLSATARDAQPQAIGSVISYLRRYGLASLLGIATGDDDDGEASMGRAVPVAPMAPKTPPLAPTPGPATRETDQARAERIQELYVAAMQRIHAAGKEVGLEHEQLREVLGVESMTKLTPKELNYASELLNARSLDDLKDRWEMLGSLGVAAQYQKLKEYMKGRLS